MHQHTRSNTSKTTHTYTYLSIHHRQICPLLADKPTVGTVHVAPDLVQAAPAVQQELLDRRVVWTAVGEAAVRVGSAGHGPGIAGHV